MFRVPTSDAPYKNQSPERRNHPIVVRSATFPRRGSLLLPEIPGTHQCSSSQQIAIEARNPSPTASFRSRGCKYAGLKSHARWGLMGFLSLLLALLVSLGQPMSILSVWSTYWLLMGSEQVPPWFEQPHSQKKTCSTRWRDGGT